MNQEIFNDAVYKDKELSVSRKIELLEMCRAGSDEKTIYKEFSLIKNAE